jgi:Holliday junction resolvase RusA-like endonuclease
MLPQMVIASQGNSIILIDAFIPGTPYYQDKERGNVDASQEWSDGVIKATAELPKIQGPCFADIDFMLPDNKFPKDCPYGPDIDNLLKRMFSALNKTVFSEVVGKDSAVCSVTATKHKSVQENPVGVRLRIYDYEGDW